MAEYIDKEAAISLIKQYGHDAIDGGRYSLDTVDDCIELANRIKALSTEDVVPVVRCKDCMHYLIVDEFEGGKRYMCKVNHFSYINSDGDMHYCSYGERKNGGDNDAVD